MLYPVPK